MTRLRRSAARGYTIVELMMALTCLAIGVSGVIAMQKVAIAANRSAKEIAIATRIGEAWADALAADAMTWSSDDSTTPPTSTLPNTTWLNVANPSATVGWLIPTYSPALGFGPSFNGLGAPVDPSTSAAKAHFCVQVRYAFLHSETLPTAGNGVIRAQVLVFWPREDAASTLSAAILANLCAVSNADLTSNIGAFHVLYLTTAVRQTPQGLLN